MVSLNILIPKVLLEKLKEKAEREAKTIEEIIVESSLQSVNVRDPEVKVSFHLSLCEKYLREAEEFLSKGDVVQASEKAWGAAAQIVKAMAAKEGVEIRSHKGLHEYVGKIVERTGDCEIGRLWRSASALHVNFYENWLPIGLVKDGIEDVKKLVEKLKKFL